MEPHYYFIGWMGSIMLSICALPQVVHTYRTKLTSGLSWMFLLLWLAGEVFTLYYILWSDYNDHIVHMPLYVNYLFNIIMVIYLIYAKASYRESREDG